MADYPKTSLILFKEAEKMNLKPQWLTDYGLFSINVNNNLGYIFYSRNMFNSNLSGSLVVDKHATRVVLHQNNIRNIPYDVCKSKKEVIKFLTIHKKIIAKPLFGSSSNDVHLITTPDDIPDIMYENYLFEKFIKGKEMRYLIFNGKVIAVHRKLYESPINNPEKVKRISFSKDLWDEKLIQLSINITEIFYMKFAAVDYLIDTDNEVFVLEVNNSPGLFFFEHPSNGPAIPIARLFLEETIKAIHQFQVVK